MQRHPVHSSQLKSVGYDARHEQMEVEFADGGTYLYHHVPRAKYLALISAKSIGTFYNTHFKGNAEHRAK